MASTQLETILHYATSHSVPEQSKAEIKLSYDVLRERAPCNFLVFGLGHDSQMWHAFNPGGKTLFLEEDLKWLGKVLHDAPFINGKYIKYRTQLKEADQLLKSYKFVPDCDPAKGVPLKENDKCKLALNMLPNEVYDTEWDVIMIDAPKGYFMDAPGRMAAIYSAAVMARNRKSSGGTHVYLHDVDRKTEKKYAEEFLCKKYLVKGEGRLWHFLIPSVVNSTVAVKPYAFD
ncbi:arabinogalactan O-methyltransferase 1-like [Apium graveolens]|uniref:arabinogalactan O-methyltransferase 1-like n=1 Tax=Apium graveolens TaxID=4045 RepID=UPI003D7A4C6E